MKNNLLIFGTKNFNNSLNEIKEYLNFSLVFYNKHSFLESSIKSINCVLLYSEKSNDADTLSLINKLKNKPLLLLKKQNFNSIINFNCNDTVTLPLNLLEISNRINNLITTQKFNQNSFLKIKEYIVDKNERKLKKESLSINITEREIELIELLFSEKKPLSKKNILKKVWKYADDTDTHTLETHVYRLRKKISDQFKDENFIINLKDGYSI
jgi:DNA-binding response OmpR family regulator